LKQNLAPDDYLVEQYRGFVENEMLVILGQLDKPSQIFEYLYLGTEWNASNWDELNANKYSISLFNYRILLIDYRIQLFNYRILLINYRILSFSVKYILNMTKEVDNFYPSHFQYMKIPVSDHDSTELLKHWNRTFEFIKRAKSVFFIPPPFNQKRKLNRECKSGVLVHCKKGISRSSSTVIAYAMKAYGWSLSIALEHVKRKRDCITPNPGVLIYCPKKKKSNQPNPGFMRQLEVYDGMLAAKNSFLNGSHLLHKSNQPIPRGSRWRSRQPRITDPSVLFVALSDPTETKVLLQLYFHSFVQ
jgi:protein phosphatase slingshot